MTNDGFNDALWQCWWRESVDGRGDRWVERLERCAQHLESWGSNTFGNISRKIKDQQEKLESLDKHSRLGDVRGETRRLENDLNRLLALNESYWRQRSRVEWLKFGDGNT